MERTSEAVARERVQNGEDEKSDAGCDEDDVKHRKAPLWSLRWCASLCRHQGQHNASPTHINSRVAGAPFRINSIYWGLHRDRACSLRPGNENGGVDHRGSYQRHDGGKEFRMRMMAFGNEVAGSDIEKKSEKYREHDAEEAVRHGDE